MRLYKNTGNTILLGNALPADEINYIGSAFPVPALSAESIANAEGDDNYCVFYFDGNSLPADVKELLYQKAKAEIEAATHYGELPDGLTDGTRYAFDIIFAPNGEPREIRIGCELLLADNWMDCGNADYIKYINGYMEKYGKANNLNQICGAYSAIGAILWDANEYKQVCDYVTAYLD